MVPIFHRPMGPSHHSLEAINSMSTFEVIFLPFALDFVQAFHIDISGYGLGLEESILI